MKSISVRAARRIALAAQGFTDRRPAGGPSARQFRRHYERAHIVQIDSVNVLARAHYLPAYSRWGPYPLAAFDRVEYPQRRVYESWAHVASYTSVENEPLLRWRMQPSQRLLDSYVGRIAVAKPDFVNEIRRAVTERGPVAGSELDPDRSGKVAGEMWSWHDTKAALEWLFHTGEIVPVRRNAQFERVYDLTDRVIPQHIAEQPTPSRDDARRALLALGAQAHGIATAGHIRDYFRLRGLDLNALLQDLVDDGVVEPVKVSGLDRTWYLHRDAVQPRNVSASTLLSPFDPLVWERHRTEHLWDTHYRIEIYTPAAKRIYGYYVLLFLLDEQLAARVDLKADRQRGALLVQSAFQIESCTLEPGYVTDRLRDHLNAIAEWLGLSDVVVAQRGDLASLLR